MIQFNLLHTKYHLCSPTTRSLLLSTYMKFINLFPEIKQHVQDVLRHDSNYRSSDVEIQQRATEYLRLSEVCSPTVLATVLEIMPPYPEKQSPLLVRLKQKKPLMEAEDTSEPSTTPAAHVDETPKLTVNAPPPQQQQDGLLLALDTDESYATYSPATSNSVPTATNTSQSSTKKFLFKNSDIIFENDLLQIGIKSELKKSVLQLEFYYGNKTNSTLSNISTSINQHGDFDPG